MLATSRMIRLFEACDIEEHQQAYLSRPRRPRFLVVEQQMKIFFSVKAVMGITADIRITGSLLEQVPDLPPE